METCDISDCTISCCNLLKRYWGVRVWFSLCCTGLFGWFGAALQTFFLFGCLRETLVVSKVLGGFFFSSETVNYRLMGNCSDGADRKFEVSEQLPWFHRSVLKGTEKRATKRVEYRCCAFYHPHKTCLATNQVVNRFEHGCKNAQYRYSTRFAAMLQNKLYVFCCPLFRTRSFMKRFHFAPRWRGFAAKHQYR